MAQPNTWAYEYPLVVGAAVAKGVVHPVYQGPGNGLLVSKLKGTADPAHLTS